MNSSRSVLLAVVATALWAPALCADRIVLKDGRAFDGAVVEESTAAIRFRSGKVSFWIPRADVARLERAEEPAAEAARRRSALAAGDADGRVALAAWCEAQGLAAEARALREDALRIAPDHAAARRALGYVRVDGAWKTEEEVARAAGRVRHGAAWVTPDEDRGLTRLERYRVASEADRPALLRAAADDVPAAAALVEIARARLDAIEKQVLADGGEHAVLKAREALLLSRTRLWTIVLDHGRYDAAKLPEAVQEEVRRLPRELDRIARDPAAWLLDVRPEYARPAAEVAALEALLALRSAEAAEVAAARAALHDRIAARVPGARVVDDPEVQPFRAERQTIEAKNADLAAALSEDDRELLRLTNDYRGVMGLRPVLLDRRLALAALHHSEDMETHRYFSHIAPDPARATVDRRASAEGFVSDIVGENIAEGDYAPGEIFDAWRDSLGHHRNLLEARFRTVGFGRAGNHWTQVLAGEEAKRGR